ncbi:TIGR04066 family peptide maturation system protein [Neglecta sp. X4]|uniref:TIGR04066 family peptide maturation system protein n=1 Tax=unclassified Neglectibacter TaxID=2632164 RepID=UPI00137150A6|nr:MULTISPECIES: TIGR04066 family peptide maturation system protein [unclassified Neglectibacter]NBI18798.1 TIGR04066 family peptide maturation system protein [Neglectibacter sp. 59]NBJ74461.1 TIGR04066 family peptide maturation system protein [Neglectibacter sp. X4]NCE82297.1 TIGR04066 family peptide maturation system protein [Neglectibacter sp. X58]
MKLLVYPMNKSLAPLGRYVDMLDGYDQVIPVAPRSFGYGTSDMATVDGGMESGVNITHDLKSALEVCDAAFLDYYPTANLDGKQYMDVLQSLVNAGKRVWISDDLQDFLVRHGYEEIGGLPVKILEYNKSNIVLNEEKRLLELPVPCIFVFGSGDLTNKFDIQLGLRRAFQKAGYVVTQLGTKKYSPLFGFDPLPKFILEPGGSQKKVLDFNHYVYEKAKSENADVVIIGIPGGIMPNNPYQFTEFGEPAFLIGNALKSDVSILSLYCAPYPQETLQYLLNICKYRFSSPTHYISLACQDMMVSPETLEFQTLSIPVKRIKEDILPQVTCPGAKVYAAMDTEGMNYVAEQILAELSENI